MKKKSLCAFIVCLALTLVFASGAVVNYALGVVRPDFESSGDYVAAASDGETLYLAASDGKVTDIGGETYVTLPSKPLYMQPIGSRLYALCENRTLYLIDGGEIKASREFIYRPSAMCVSGSRVYVGGTLGADRNNLYCVKSGNLEFVDLTPNAAAPERGENEDADVYAERINALKVNYPIVGINADEGSITTVNAYGGIDLYSADGTHTGGESTAYNFTAAAFAGGKAYISDDNGGVLFYADGESKYIKLSSHSLVGITADGDGAFALDRAGLVYKIKGALKAYTTDLKLRSSGLYRHGGSIVLLASNGSAAVYPSSGLKRLGWTGTLEIILIVLACTAAAALAISAVALFAPSAFAVFARAVKKLGKKLFASKLSYLLLLPTVLIAVVFAYYPAIKGLILAFFEVEPGGVDVWCGLDNFRAVFTNGYFWSGMKNMLIFLVTDLIKGLVPAFIFAELIIVMRSKRAQYATRVLLYLPGIIPGVATLLIWQTGIFGMDGLVNNIVRSFGGTAQPWLGQSKSAVASLIMFGFPWVGAYIILYGALKGIPPSYYEAAKLDGCSWWRRLIMIDLPLISPQLKYIFVTCFIGSVQDFQRVFMTTEGAHGTYIPMLELYYNLTLFNNLGVAAAMGLLLFAVLMVATLINLKLKTVDSFD